ncbi:uncharacterized protein IL334_006670 [Kwoniella shivajii]|uniref:Cyclin-D1-binding protein 1-like N-terminal domain-containing protein n=1 Tax=Kwoniella shivajii TaxID=564305 RepID=A0ABZ1D8J1_9TREE|nr:hypothetical protein IL334_006670 [Kwoniella shivajii]
MLEISTKDVKQNHTDINNILSLIPFHKNISNDNMADPKLSKALKESRKSILSSVKALSSANQDSSPLPPALGEVVSQLLAQLRQSITALGVSYNPPITIEGAIQQLERISEYIGKLISCVLLCSSSQLLAEEWKSGITNITEEIVRHISVLEQNENDAYLSSTGMVWESIDNLSKELSKDETQALRRRWKSHQSTVKDAWEEFKELLDAGTKRTEGKEQDEDDEDENGEWDELDLGGEELSDDERNTAEAAKPLLALYQILHSTIPRFFDRVKEDEYRSLLIASTEFVDAYDGAVSAMHPAQDTQEIEETLQEIESVSRKMAGMVSDKGISKWTERLDVEKKKWGERRLDMKSLSEAI